LCDRTTPSNSRLAMECGLHIGQSLRREVLRMVLKIVGKPMEFQTWMHCTRLLFWTELRLWAFDRVALLNPEDYIVQGRSRCMRAMLKAALVEFFLNAMSKFLKITSLQKKIAKGKQSIQRICKVLESMLGWPSI
jgi:hypothetical protein